MAVKLQKELKYQRNKIFVMCYMTFIALIHYFSRWQKVTLIMSQSLNHSFNYFKTLISGAKNTPLPCKCSWVKVFGLKYRFPKIILKYSSKVLKYLRPHLYNDSLNLIPLDLKKVFLWRSVSLRQHSFEPINVTLTSACCSHFSVLRIAASFPPFRYWECLYCCCKIFYLMKTIC